MYIYSSLTIVGWCCEGRIVLQFEVDIYFRMPNNLRAHHCGLELDQSFRFLWKALLNIKKSPHIIQRQRNASTVCGWSRYQNMGCHRCRESSTRANLSDVIYVSSLRISRTNLDSSKDLLRLLELPYQRVSPSISLLYFKFWSSSRCKFFFWSRRCCGCWTQRAPRPRRGQSGCRLLAYQLRNTFYVVFFFHFILRFWNQILICLSVRPKAWAISIRRRLVRYRLKWNSFSSSRVWYLVYAVLERFVGSWLLWCPERK